MASFGTDMLSGSTSSPINLLAFCSHLSPDYTQQVLFDHMQFVEPYSGLKVAQPIARWLGGILDGLEGTWCRWV